MRLLALLAVTASCASLMGRDVVPSAGLKQTGSPGPRCVDAVVTAADTLLPDPSLRPLRGIVYWSPAPFDCGAAGMVWGCSDLTRNYISVKVAADPATHAADSALPEEIAHWVWQRYRPGTLTEWRGPDGVYHRDPDFEAWYLLVADTARGACK